MHWGVDDKRKMTTQKILFLSPVEYFKGGAERSLFDLISNPEITPILAAPAEGQILEKGRALGIETHVISFGSINSVHRPFSFMKGLSVFNSLFLSANALKKLSKKTGTKIVHSNGLKAHAINVISRCIGGAHAVLHIRDIPYTKTEIIVWKILKALCSKMILVSHACWPEGTLPSKVSVIHNGTPLIETSYEIKNLNGINFGFIGRIHPAKGLDLLINWIFAARQAGLLATLTVRGTYSEDAPHYEHQINNLIQELKLNGYIDFTGFIDDSAALYLDIDIVVVPSKIPDPLPRSVMEAMARGIPVFGYPAGGIYEMIENGKTGFLVKDSESFLGAVTHISANAEKRQVLIKNAKEKIENEFSMKNLYEGVNEIYKEI